MAKPELLSCPFCGGAAEIGSASVYCDDCGAQIWASQYLRENIPAAVKSWNKRVENELTGFSPEEISILSKVKTENRLVILPSKSDEVIRIVELALHIKLYDWQIAYITGASTYVMPGRASGHTTAYMVKLCLSEGEPIDLSKRSEIERYADGMHGTHYFDWFRSHLWDVYYELQRIGGLKLRKIYFTKQERR